MTSRALPALSLVALLGAVVPTLQGCFPAVAAGVAVGTIAVTDRRSFATQAVDEEIEFKAEARIRDKFGDKVHVSVISFNRKVLLLGETPLAAQKAEVAEIVRGVPNVDAMTDDLSVSGVSSLTARSNDAYITSKVKARFVEASKFSANHVKVITEASSVYLLGLVTQREAKDAIEIARTTAGVRKVVNMMETISEAKAAELDNRQDSARQDPAPVATPPGRR